MGREDVAEAWVIAVVAMEPFESALVFLVVGVTLVVLIPKDWQAASRAACALCMSSNMAKLPSVPVLPLPA
jgi:hypothetical protein